VRLRIIAAVAGTVVLAIALAFTALVGPARAVSYSAEELAFVRLINEYRLSVGVDPLLVSDLVSDAAEKHSLDMAKYGLNPTNPHDSWYSDFFPWGVNAGQRMTLCGYPSGSGWGEIIAAGPSLATTAFSAWRASPTHNPRMVDASYRVMGVARVYAPDSEYPYYWTVDFGGVVDSTARRLDDASPSSTTTTSEVPSTTSTTTSTTTTTTVPATTTTTSSPPATTTTVLPPVPTTFADVKEGHIFYEPIMALAELGVVSGSGVYYLSLIHI